MENLNSQEDLSKMVAKKIAYAKENSMYESHLIQLEKEALTLDKNTKEAEVRELEIEQEILASSVVASNLVEYKEVLRQISEMYGQTEEWAISMLAHENSHANVAEQLNFHLSGYIVLFAKDELGRISLVQPAFLNRSRREWGYLESQMKQITVTDAPTQYGAVPSPADEIEVDRMRSIVDLHEKASQNNAAEIERIKKELGDLYRF